MRLQLLRDSSTDFGTFGTLVLPSGKVLQTGELPWHDNANELSCIPNGLYTCAWSYSPHLKRNSYQVTDVPNRTGIRIHKGNFCGDTTLGYQADELGCIVVGELRGHLTNAKGVDQLAILRSTPALAALESELGQQTFELEISGP